MKVNMKFIHVFVIYLKRNVKSTCTGCIIKTLGSPYIYRIMNDRYLMHKNNGGDDSMICEKKMRIGCYRVVHNLHGITKISKLLSQVEGNQCS